MQSFESKICKLVRGARSLSHTHTHTNTNAHGELRIYIGRRMKFKQTGLSENNSPNEKPISIKTHFFSIALQSNEGKAKRESESLVLRDKMHTHL